ncbi:MAG: hypothetical protein ACI9SP_000776 [Arenicella sp.]|jgi:hypothetical protein
MRAQIKAVKESNWRPLTNKQGIAVVGQDTCRTSFCIGDYENAFTLVIQPKAYEGQTSLLKFLNRDLGKIANFQCLLNHPYHKRKADENKKTRSCYYY